MDNRVVIVLSGGMDSAVLAHKLIREFSAVKAITFNYGQKHAIREIECALNLSNSLGFEHKLVEVGNLADLFGASSLINPEQIIPSGHYTEQSMKSTVVPNRNMIMLSIAAAWAMSLQYDFVAYAAHRGDHTIYPDCRPEFVKALSEAIELADWHKVSLISPFVNLSKSEICRLGNDLGVDFKKTWSCYRGAERHCGTCGTCVERREAFSLAGIEDPTEYG